MVRRELLPRNINLSGEESPVWPWDVTQLAGGLKVVRRGLLPRNWRGVTWLVLGHHPACWGADGGQEGAVTQKLERSHLFGHGKSPSLLGG